MSVPELCLQTPEGRDRALASLFLNTLSHQAGSPRVIAVQPPEDLSWDGMSGVFWGPSWAVLTPGKGERGAGRPSALYPTLPIPAHLYGRPFPECSGSRRVFPARDPRPAQTG